MDGFFSRISRWLGTIWNTGVDREKYLLTLQRLSRRFTTKENVESVNPDTFSVTFASVKNNKEQYMERMGYTSEALKEIFNSFNEDVQNMNSVQIEKACITNVHFDNNENPVDERVLTLQQRTVYSLDEGNRLSFLIKTESTQDQFVRMTEKVSAVKLMSMFSELDLDSECYSFAFNKDTGTCILVVENVPELVKNRYLDCKLVMQINLEYGCSTVEIVSDPFIILSAGLRPTAKPTDMFFLEEDDMDRPPFKLVGADPDLQTYLYLNIQAQITNDSEWVNTNETEVEVKFINEKGEVCRTVVSKWEKAEGRSCYFINEQIETCMFDNHTEYRVVASYLGREMAETRLFIGKDIVSRGYEWSDLTVRTSRHNSADGMQSVQEMIGLDNVKKMLDKTVCYMKLMKARQMAGLPCQGKLMHMVMAGGPGTGKTTVARLMGSVFKEMGFLSKGHLVEANRESLTDCIIGGTEKKTRRMLDMAKGGVLFIDEAYSLKSDETDDRDFGQRVIDTLMTELSNPDDDTLVILAGYSKEMDRMLRCNPGLASRFPVRIDFPDYTPDELMQIAHLFFQKNKYTLAEGVEKRMMEVFTQAVTQKNFGNGRFVHAFIQNSILPQMGGRLMEQIEKGGYDESLLSEIRPEDIPDVFSVLSSMGLAKQKNKVIGFAR